MKMYYRKLGSGIIYQNQEVFVTKSYILALHNRWGKSLGFRNLFNKDNIIRLHILKTLNLK